MWSNSEVGYKDVSVYEEMERSDTFMMLGVDFEDRQKPLHFFLWESKIRVSLVEITKCLAMPNNLRLLAN